MHARFHAPDASRVGQRVALADDEAAHLTRVLRLKAGAVVRLFDGAGHEFLAVVESADRAGAQLRIESVAAAVAEPRVQITLAKPLSSVGTTPPAAATVLIGPEGGWSSGELLRAAERGVALITLRAPTLRADAMPAVALAALLSRWEW